MVVVDSYRSATKSLRPSQWFETLGLSKYAPARDADGLIAEPDEYDVASLSLYGALQRSYVNDAARWLEVATKLDALLADLHADPEMRMSHSWLPDSRFDRIARANDHPEFTREHAAWLFSLIDE
jgi:hypothetical protein